MRNAVQEIETLANLEYYAKLINDELDTCFTGLVDLMKVRYPTVVL